MVERKLEKQLRTTASEAFLRKIFYKLDHNTNLKAIEFLEEIKKQMYFDGYEDALKNE